MTCGFEVSRAGRLDFLSLGALVVRLYPGLVPIRKTHDFEVRMTSRCTSVAASSTLTSTWQTASASERASSPRWSTTRSAT
jgi:2-dehydro-3-deoxygluconokinase